MTGSRGHHGSDTSRRELLQRLGRLVAAAGLPSGLGSGCGGSAAVAQPPPVPAPIPLTVRRLKAALAAAAPAEPAPVPVDVHQAPGEPGEPSLGRNAVIWPTPRGIEVNPNPVTLVELPQVWGYRRETWSRWAPTYLGSDASNASWFVPVRVVHPSATQNAGALCAFHFVHTGQIFEVLCAGVGVAVTLFANGRRMSAKAITTALRSGVEGEPLNRPNAYTSFDFGSAATRQISLYITSGLGTCAFAVAAGDTLAPWDRSAAPSMVCMSDSYGGAASRDWVFGGIFYGAAQRLGIPHVDMSAIGGTGYAPNTAVPDPGDAFSARMPAIAAFEPDLFLTAGGINDNNWQALPPYASAEAARAGFDDAVFAYFRTLRARLPEAVLAAIGPWQPNALAYRDVALAKAATISNALRAISGPWVFIDNLQGGWVNSSGVSAAADGGAWQTGTGTVAKPAGDGNGDLYVSADGTHPTETGADHLAERLASGLRASLLAL